MNRIDSWDLAAWPDPDTDPRLLPPHLRTGSPDRRLLCHRVAVEKAIEHFLTDQQRGILRMRYWRRMSLSQIGGAMGLSPSAVSKRLNGILESLRTWVDYFVETYIALCQEEDRLLDD